MAADLEEIIELELALLTPAVRHDRSAVAALLHSDFREVGASGRTWTRAEILDELARSSDRGSPEVSEVKAVELADRVVLITFTTATTERTVHRCSIWVSDGAAWSVIYHQATPAGNGR
jgi:hypothetical protein